MSEMKSYDPVWDGIYGRGEQLNRYPFDSVVSFLFRHRPRDKAREDTRVLEIGCGAGNNLWFAAREGFDVTGIDASAPALDFARTRFADDGLTGRFELADFTALPFEAGSFDIVIDRGALTQAPKPMAKTAVAEAARVLLKGGLMYSEIYSDRTSARGNAMDGGLMTVTDGPYQGVGQIAFYSRGDMVALFADQLELIALDHTETLTALQKPYELYAHWSATARRL